MNWYDPIPVHLPADVTPWNRVLTFLGHYDVRFYCTPGAYVDIGAGSLPCVNNLMLVPAGDAGKVGDIGRFCEMHPSARILVRGEHANDQPVNICFSGLPLVNGGFDAHGLKPTDSFRIGNGVVVSANAQILSGRSIGDGAVIGASSVVTRDVEALAICAGVPARTLRVRDAFAPWWNFQVAYLMANQAQLQALAADPLAAHPYRPQRPRFVLRNEVTSISFMGFLDGEIVRPLDQAPPAVHDYVVQAFGTGPTYWLADCWA